MTITMICTMIAAMAGVPAQGDGIRAAVVDVAAVSEGYDKRTDLEVKFNAKRQAFQTEVEARKAELKAISDALSNGLYKKGTAQYNSKRQEQASMEAQLKVYVETEAQTLDAQINDALRTIYDDIKAMVATIAKERDFDLVLSRDRVGENLPESPDLLRQQILLQKVVYYDPGLDITDDVLKRLNTVYRNEQAKNDKDATKDGKEGTAKPE